ncbi:hypothetical protein BCR37DRAFT_381067 [Protomyces lactucae-debilis]|uniref:NAD(+) hydrolase ThsA Sir2/TIR-associating SLOG domain-containing protein n=1 Tax=Protomyces lactucae-debilis TaxID=2754530 RepID=A0A1Y2F9U2_PROLT|nr:uncharacterized protein BCR37DRAFT_381067 [Protomyces lactucae-debilis]ORY80397.1 hypothetical protein BCR37DRAFT_381067 [Protomyces lactucae-debilis]
MTHAARSRYFYNVRQDLISKANIMIIISGEKHGKDGSMVHSDTVMSEYTLGIEHGRFAIPVATFGGCSEIVHTKIAQDIKKRMHPYSALPNGLFAKLADKETSTDEMIETVFDIADWIVEHKLAASSRRSSIASDGGAHPFHSRTPSGVSLRGSERPRSSNHQTNKTSP